VKMCVKTEDGTRLLRRPLPVGLLDRGRRSVAQKTENCCTLVMNGVLLRFRYTGVHWSRTSYVLGTQPCSSSSMTNRCYLPAVHSSSRHSSRSR